HAAAPITEKIAPMTNAVVHWSWPERYATIGMPINPPPLPPVFKTPPADIVSARATNIVPAQKGASQSSTTAYASARATTAPYGLLMLTVRRSRAPDAGSATIGTSLNPQVLPNREQVIPTS